MKKFLILAGLLVTCVTGPLTVDVGAVFPAEDLTVLDVKGITALTDDQLVEAYIDVLTEIDATKMFHATSGFTPKEYKKYKELLKYRLQLIFEIHRRKIELPPLVN